jgi:predicted MPP superfamily phosphohydrolase
MLTDERVHTTIMNIQSELRILRRTHEQNLQILSDILLFYGFYFRPLLNNKYITSYDKKLESLESKLRSYKVSDNKKAISYEFDVNKEFQKLLFSMLRDFQQSMRYFYKGSINNTSLDEIDFGEEGEEDGN